MVVATTGITGLNSSHLCERPVAGGQAVLDNFHPFHPENFEVENLRQLNQADNLYFFEEDIRDKGAITNIFESVGIDVAAQYEIELGIRKSVDWYNDSEASLYFGVRLCNKYLVLSKVLL